jgi:hypothetical protein
MCARSTQEQPDKNAQDEEGDRGCNHHDDECVEPLDFDRLAQADIVALTGMVVQRARMREILVELNRRGVFTVVGGPWVSVQEDAFGDLADVIFVGEAEDSWPRFGTYPPSARIYLFETATLRQRLSISLDHGYPRLLDFSPNGRFLAGAVSDGTVLVWDLR